MPQSFVETAQRFLGDAYNRETGEINIEKIREHAFQTRGKTNILLMGATGSGKSSLINAIFGDDVVKAGSGAPVTQHMEKIEIKEKGLVLWDTKGIEAGNYKDTMLQLKGEVETAFKSDRGPDEFPHIALLCIKESSSRVEDREHELLAITKEHGIPALVVFTDMRGDEGEEFVKQAKAIFEEKHGGYVKGYARVNSIPYKIGKVTIEVEGISELVEMIEQCIELGHANAAVNAAKNFAKIQKANIERKLAAMTDGAKTIIHVAAAAAGAAGALPIPGSDAPVIAAIQSGMIYKLNTEFEVSTAEASMTSLITGILGTTAVAQVGRTGVANALKFIPGAGTLIGGAISAATAVAITEAIGFAYLEVLTRYFNKETGEVELPEELTAVLSVFKDFFGQFYKK